MADVLETAKGIGAAVVMLAVVVLVAGSVVGIADDQAGSQNISEDVLITGGQGSLSKTGALSNFSAHQSLNTTLAFTGADDSYLEGSADLSGTVDDTWSATTWVRLHPSIDKPNATMRALRFGGWLYIDYNQTEWRVIYYDSSTLNSYLLEASATNATNWTHLIVERENGTTTDRLTLWENNTSLASITLDDGNQTSANFSADNLHGRVEETRLYDDDLTNSQRSQLVDEPTAPVKANETARIYYDLRQAGAAVPVYRTGAELTQSNATLVDGFSGQGAHAGTDYSRSGSTITALDAGTLDGAPVVFVSYTWADYLGPFAGVLNALTSIGSAALTLLVVGLVVISARVVIDEFDGGF